MSQAEDEEIPLGRLASGIGEASATGHDTPGQSKDTLATPAPSQRQLHQTRSQTRHSDVGSVDQPNAKASQAAEDQLQAPPDPSLGDGVEVGSPKGASLPEQFAAMETDSTAAAANDDEDVDIEGEATTAAEAEGQSEQPASSATAADTAKAAAPAPATAAEAAMPAPATAATAAEAMTPTPAKANEAANAVTPAPAKAAEHEQPPSRGRGSRGGRRGARGGRGRGRSKSRGRARAASNTSPRAPSEQDQADFADQLDQSPSHAEADSGDAQAEQSDDKDVSISDVTEQPRQPQKRSSVRRGKSDASQASDQLTSARSRASKEASVSGTAAPENAKVPGLQTSTAPEAEEAAKQPKSAAAAAAAADVKVQKAKEPRTASQEGKELAVTDEPPTKRPRRAASGANQRAAENGKAKGGRTQARRGVVESDSDDNSDGDIDIEGVQDGVPVSDNGEDAAAKGTDDRPQAQASKKRGRSNEEAPARKGRPKPAPAPAPPSAKGPGFAAAARAGKAAGEGARPPGAAAKSGKASMGAPTAVKEKRPGSGKQDASQPAAKPAPGDPKQAAEYHTGLLESAVKQFHEARIMFEEAQAALTQAAGQVESTLDNIGQLSGLTMEILKEFRIGKAVGSLNKLARLHPGITACDHIASKASEVTQLLKKQVGVATAAPGQQPQGPCQQPKKAALKPEPKPTPPPSPATVTADAAAGPVPAAATSLPAAASVKPVPGVSHDTGKPEAAAAPHQHAAGTAPSPAAAPAPASSASHQASHVKMEAAASRSASPGAQQGQDRRKVPAAAGAMPGSAPQASTRQRMDSGPKQSDAGPTVQFEQSQSGFEGLVAQSLGDSVRDKAVAILALALSSPSELTPQEAAVAVEAAVFAHFAEEGKPASRYKRRLHALWSYLRGTDHSEVVPNLRQKVLQGEIMAKTLAKITRPQAQHLCHLKSIPGSQPKHQVQPPAMQTQPVSHPLQQQQPRSQQASQQLPSSAQLPQQLPQQLLQPQQQQQPVSHSQALPAIQQQQQPPQLQQHPPYYQAAAPYSAPGVYGYDPALYLQPWHNPHPHPHPHHQQPVGVQVAPPGATLPPFDVHTAIPAPPLHPADTPALSQPPPSSLPWSQAPPPPDEPPPVGMPSAPTREIPSSSSAQPAAASVAASSALNHAAVHMAMPAPTDATTATPAATPQATQSTPTHAPPQTQTRAEAIAGDQHMAQAVTAGMPATSPPGADAAAALSSQTPSEQPQPAQEREVPGEPVIARSTSDAMDTS